jgi:predicted SAM-dependent methyltransferase
MDCLNIGCGSRFHPAWTNIDANSTSSDVRVHDCRAGIPFPDHAFDVVYHSHVLEHFPKTEALRFVQECFRVLRPGGIIRVAVPDLECLARLYLCAIDKAAGGDTQWQHNYDWLMLELYDQTVRNRSGGAMIEYLKQDPLPNKAFLLERCGGEIRRILEAIRNSTRPKQTRLPFIEVITRRLFAIPQKVLTRFRQKLLGSQGSEALQIGQFRLAGEVHQWMYDRYSLTRLLEQAGFQNPQRRGPTESVIPGWASFHLDTDPDGSTYKPDSIYMEAVKPQ